MLRGVSPLPVEDIWFPRTELTRFLSFAASRALRPGNPINLPVTKTFPPRGPIIGRFVRERYKRLRDGNAKFLPIARIFPCNENLWKRWTRPGWTNVSFERSSFTVHPVKYVREYRNDNTDVMASVETVSIASRVLLHPETFSMERLLPLLSRARASRLESFAPTRHRAVPAYSNRVRIRGLDIILFKRCML